MSAPVMTDARVYAMRARLRNQANADLSDMIGSAQQLVVGGVRRLAFPDGTVATMDGDIVATGDAA